MEGVFKRSATPPNPSSMGKIEKSKIDSALVRNTHFCEGFLKAKGGTICKVAARRLRGGRKEAERRVGGGALADPPSGATEPEMLRNRVF